MSNPYQGYPGIPHEDNESSGQGYNLYGVPIEDLITSNPEATLQTIEQESASTIPAHERDIDNPLLCKKIFAVISHIYPSPAEEEKDREAFLTGIRWAYAFACKTDMQQTPRLSDGYSSIPVDPDKAMAGIVLDAMDFGVASEVVTQVVNELAPHIDLDQDGHERARQGLVIGFYLINNGEDEKLHEPPTQKYFVGDEYNDDLEDELRLDERMEEDAKLRAVALKVKPVAAPLNTAESVVWDAVVAGYYGKTS